MKLLIPLTVLMFVTATASQVKTFRWDTELCRFSGTYNSRKYSEARLRNTVRLMRSGEFGLDSQATVWKYEEIASLDVAKLDKRYADAVAALKGLSIVKSPYWENVRRIKLNEVEQVYRLSRATMLGYTRPAALQEYSGADSCKAKFTASLITGGDRLLAVWKAVNEDSRSKNADPARLKRIFDEQMASPDRLKFALVETMSFGWWNCANEFIEYDTGDNSQAREREFRKLFIRVRDLGCDEP